MGTIRNAQQAVSSSIKGILDADRFVKRSVDILKAEGEINEPILHMLESHLLMASSRYPANA